MSTALRTYYRGAGLVAMRDHVNGVTRNYKCDHQGTVQCLTDNQGAVTDRFACDAWGVEVKREGTSINRHWYIGRSGLCLDPNGTTAWGPAQHYVAPRRSLLGQPPRALWAVYVAAWNTPSRLAFARVGSSAAPRSALQQGTPAKPRKLATLRCPPQSCDGTVAAGAPCTDVGDLSAYLERNNDKPGSAEQVGVHSFEIILGYRDLPGKRLRTECHCSNVQWVQMIQTNVEPATDRYNTWYVDDAAYHRKRKPRLNCFYGGTNSAGQAQPPNGVVIPPDVTYWLHDDPVRTDDAILAEVRDRNPSGWQFQAVSCLVCVVQKPGQQKPTNWIMQESCIYWGLFAPIRNGKVGPTVAQPVARPAGQLLFQVLSRIYTEDQCTAQQGAWEVSNCPPRVLSS